ncbi:UDP-N-acetylglucosamine 2-epimerase-like protein [Actinomyces naeslundii str. Howell 279]|nr:UDP-N-acetylglucosamine 2-epimerase-like protein [Actinomyces naeslundii str. Howell 279]
MTELDLPEGGYSLATIHRAENTDDPERLRSILESLAAVDHPVVLLAHPRLVAKCAEHGIALGDSGNLRMHPPLAYPELVASTLHARGVVTDSGGLQKEAFLLRAPCTTVRPQTEWVETVNLGWNVLVEPGQALVRAASRPRPTEPAEAEAHPYGDGNAAHRVVQALTDHLPG